jgi:crotonobetainyl-CoA:carnitine CoA-transferase CaiB-like acyl-CoA transferase
VTETGAGPLDGVRVLDFSLVMSGPHCTRMLVDLGADVIKVEPPGGDLTRFFRPRAGSIALYHAQQNCGKRNLSADLHRPEAVELMLRLVERVDVVVENFRPGVMHRLGLGYPEASARNPRLVYASISGFGQRGQSAGRRAYADIIHAEMGMTEMLGRRQRHPGTSFNHADTYTGLECLAGVLAALLQRERTGRGQHVDVAMAETLLAVNEWASRELAGGAEDPLSPAGGPATPMLTTADGRRVVVTGNPVTRGVFESWCACMGRPELGEDPRFATAEARLEHREELLAVLQEWAGRLESPAALEEALAPARLATGVVRSVEEAGAGEWARERGAVVEVDDRSGGRLRLPNSPWRFSDAATGVRGVPAFRGEHNREVLEQLLGMRAEEVDALEAAGVLSSRFGSGGG